uniref:MAK10-like protein n=1 Tax=Tanacetum cinerariifolium TaxID=118510 RepID=A0A6L2M9A0_TANCI|nr:MAK10-like protein [Tanacetum cinerariifolium]
MLFDVITLYENKSWNDLRDFSKPVKGISLPLDIPSTSDRRLIDLENQVQRLMEAHLALNPLAQVNKIASSCEICSGPHDAQYCMEIPSKHLLVMHPRVATKLEEQAYIDLDSPINVMSRINYYWIMSEGLKSKRKLSNSEKISNFIGRVKRLKVFVGNFTYGCDFIIIEDTTTVIDYYLEVMVLGNPFMKEFGLVYDKNEGMVAFRKDEEMITFKMPHKMERFKHIDKEILKTDNIPPFIITDNDSEKKPLHR